MHKIREENIEIYSIDLDNNINIIDPEDYYLEETTNSIVFKTPPKDVKLYINYETDYNITTSNLYTKKVDLEKYKEVMIGNINGNNKIFRTHYPFIKESLIVYITTDYEEYVANYSDYRIQEDNMTIIFELAPYGKKITASYSVLQDQSNINIGINLEWFYKSICINQNTYDYIYSFIKSFHYSSVVKQFNYNIMKNFFIKK
jgi:hypothetical protein